MFVIVSGLTGTEIAVISSAAFPALIILCVAVVLYKFGVCSRRRKSSDTRASNDRTELTEQNNTVI